MTAPSIPLTAILFEWQHGEASALAKASCTHCMGTGMRSRSVCNCVLREVFDVCFRKFRSVIENQRSLSRPSVCATSWGLKNEEYLADFHLMARRTLTDEEHKLFRYHFLLGADWSLCLRRIGGVMTKGEFFHSVYRVKQKLGRAFRETVPYGLYPLDEYFSGGQAYSGPSHSFTGLGGCY